MKKGVGIFLFILSLLIALGVGFVWGLSNQSIQPMVADQLETYGDTLKDEMEGLIELECKSAIITSEHYNDLGQYYLELIYDAAEYPECAEIIMNLQEVYNPEIESLLNKTQHKVKVLFSNNEGDKK